MVLFEPKPAGFFDIVLCRDIYEQGISSGEMKEYLDLLPGDQIAGFAG